MNVNLEVKTREWTQRRGSPQREGEFQLLGDLGTEGEEPGEGQVRGSQVKHKQASLGLNLDRIYCL